MAFGIRHIGVSDATFPPMAYAIGGSPLHDSVIAGESLLIMTIASPEQRGGIPSGPSLTCTDTVGNTYTKVPAANIHIGPLPIVDDVGEFMEFWWCPTAIALPSSGAFYLTYDGSGAIPSTFHQASYMLAITDANKTKGVFGIQNYGENDTADRDSDRNIIASYPSWSFGAQGAILSFTNCNYFAADATPIGPDFSFFTGITFTPLIQQITIKRDIPSAGVYGGQHPGVYWPDDPPFNTAVGRWKGFVSLAIEASAEVDYHLENTMPLV